MRHYATDHFPSREALRQSSLNHHVTAGDQVAKFWLNPVELQSSKRLRAHEVNQLRKLIERHQTQFLEAWHAHFES